MKATLIDPTGQPYVGGCLPRVSKVGDNTFKIFDPKTTRRAPRSIKSAIDRSLIWHIIDQAQQGSCCGCATVGAIMIAREVAGLERVVLSQASVYGLGNGGRDQGMAIDKGLSVAMEHGACSVDTVGQYDWQQFRRDYPNGHPEGERFKIIEVEDVVSVDDMDAGVELGYPVVYGAKGHAVIYIDPDVNSWGRDWGDNGFGQWTTRRERAIGIQQYGAWLIRVATDPDNDGDLPQPN